MACKNNTKLPLKQSWLEKAPHYPNVSPLQPLKNFLSFSRLAGCPINPTDPTITAFFLCPLSFVGLFFKLLLLFGMYAGVIVAAQKGGQTLSGQMEVMQDSGGLSQTEIIAIYLNFGPNLLAMVMFGFVFKRMIGGLGDFCRKFAEFDEYKVCENRLQDIYESNKKCLIRTHISAFIGSLLCCYGFYPYQAGLMPQPYKVYL